MLTAAPGRRPGKNKGRGTGLCDVGLPGGCTSRQPHIMCMAAVQRPSNTQAEHGEWTGTRFGLNVDRHRSRAECGQAQKPG
eukprot:365364-Chlamydomonas_euryale.AAC.2